MLRFILSCSNIGYYNSPRGNISSYSFIYLVRYLFSACIVPLSTYLHNVFYIFYFSYSSSNLFIQDVGSPLLTLYRTSALFLEGVLQAPSLRSVLYPPLFSVLLPSSKVILEVPGTTAGPDFPHTVVHSASGLIVLVNFSIICE